MITFGFEEVASLEFHGTLLEHQAKLIIIVLGEMATLSGLETKPGRSWAIQNGWEMKLMMVLVKRTHMYLECLQSMFQSQTGAISQTPWPWELL